MCHPPKWQGRSHSHLRSTGRPGSWLKNEKHQPRNLDHRARTSSQDLHWMIELPVSQFTNLQSLRDDIYEDAGNGAQAFAVQLQVAGYRSLTVRLVGSFWKLFESI
jgi:hypothetical protein